MSLNEVLIPANQDATWSNIYCNTLNTNDMVLENLTADNIIASGAIQGNILLVGDPQTSDNTNISASGVITTPLINSLITNTNSQYAGLETCVTLGTLGVAGVPPSNSGLNTLLWQNPFGSLPANGMTLTPSPGNEYKGFTITQKGTYVFTLNMAIDLGTPLSGDALLVFSISQNGVLTVLMSFNAGEFYKSGSLILDCNANDNISVIWQYYINTSGVSNYTLTASNNQYFTSSILVSHV